MQYGGQHGLAGVQSVSGGYEASCQCRLIAYRANTPEMAKTLLQHHIDAVTKPSGKTAKKSRRKSPVATKPGK